MFTGIIEATGKISAIKASGVDLKLTIESDSLDFTDVKLGDSIASNGVCLTVTSLHGKSFTADVSGETVKRTLFGQYKAGQLLNLEKALLSTGRLGGHLVSGHVDGISSVEKIEKFGEAWQVWIKMPKDLAHYIAEKGSITVDGISLTVNELSSSAFRLTIVPHTARETTLMSLKVGSQVHLEVDLIARYLERLLQGREGTGSKGVTMDLLQQRGFL
ncbi:riboflavin synthase [Rheinheimera tangshanensis]|jgi:riboflavin synthase|uniref:Riboflavin synthase n=1 Tax=Rheinheimera tangshanensis TaxID=400153 RepID=A0A5C8M1U9_9GAMM|nr:riboflavin synthase [Rheinheimera tangshanensis]TXK81662.1 riboflavin synthase [Rheinheimera tangshanensis]GGM56203.1 riboflavin synthase subunit alpha [Rheinheimera tangshanensis]